MGIRRTEEFSNEAVRIALTSGLPQKQVADDLGVGLSTMSVRRHIKWNTWRPDLKEDLAHLVQDIKRRLCDVASAGSPSFYA